MVRGVEMRHFDNKAFRDITKLLKKKKKKKLWADIIDEHRKSSTKY